jgi:Flp pilus assembly protein TadG
MARRTKINNSGFVMVFMALFASILVGAFAFLLVDLGRAYIARTQLRAVADGASLAALNQYVSDNCSTCPENPTDHDRIQSRIDAATDAAQRVAETNPILGVGLYSRATQTNVSMQIIFGHANENGSNFTPKDPFEDATNINAVKAILTGNYRAYFGFSNSALMHIPAPAVSSLKMPIPFDILIVFDTSLSMKDANKLRLSKQAAMAFVEYIHTLNMQLPYDNTYSERIGLLEFARGYHVTSNLLYVREDSEYQTLVSRVNELGATVEEQMGTNHETALAKAFQILRWKEDEYTYGANKNFGPPRRRRLIILLTDGLSTATYRTPMIDACADLDELPTPNDGDVASSNWYWHTADTPDGDWNFTGCCHPPNSPFPCENRALQQMPKANDKNKIMVHAIGITPDASLISPSFLNQLPRNGGKAWILVNENPDFT